MVEIIVEFSWNTLGPKSISRYCYFLSGFIILHHYDAYFSITMPNRLFIFKKLLLLFFIVVKINIIF